MSIYLITGRLGGGKGLASVGRILEYLGQGRRVVTNIDLWPENFKNKQHDKTRIIRIPDKPTIHDLESIGKGNDSYDEEKNGGIFLDELGAWMNARAWNDKGRKEVIDWLIHSRKLGWDVFFICQHIDQIDNQVRSALVEYLVECKRLDRLKIPFVGTLLDTVSLGTISGKMPKIHVAKVMYGCEFNSPVADKWVYRGNDIYNLYDTRQVFTSDYPHGSFSYLTPWHLKGRYSPPKGAKRLSRDKRSELRLKAAQMLKSGTIDYEMWRSWIKACPV